MTATSSKPFGARKDIKMTNLINNALACHQLTDGTYVTLNYDEFQPSWFDVVGESYDGFHIVEGRSELQKWTETYLDEYPASDRNDYEGIIDRIYDRNTNVTDFVEDVVRWFNRKDVIALPFYIYRHSGVVYSLGSIIGGDCFDGGLVPAGFVLLEKEKVRQLLAVKQLRAKKAEEIGKQFVKDYQAWVNGEVYFVEQVDKNGEILDDGTSFEEQLKAIASDYFDFSKVA